MLQETAGLEKLFCGQLMLQVAFVSGRVCNVPRTGVHICLVAGLRDHTLLILS